MNVNKFCRIWLLVLTVLSIFPVSFSYKASGNQSVHQYITKESINVWPLLPYDIKSHASSPINVLYDQNKILPTKYKPGKDIIYGSAEEDFPMYESMDHFWDADTPNQDILDSEPGDYNKGITIGNVAQLSSYRKAKDYWEHKVIPLYVTGKIDESYYWLGRVAHLLEDATVPAHMHNDCHLAWYYFLNLISPLYFKFPWDMCENSHMEFITYNGYVIYFLYDDDSLEEYTGVHYSNYSSVNASNQFYYYEDLIPGFNWDEVEPKDKRNIEFFRLFWYVAQKTQYFTSDDVNGNSVYINLSGNQKTFSPYLWESEGINPISNKWGIWDDDQKLWRSIL